MKEARSSQKLIGHNTQWEYLTSSLKNSSEVQAYLFFGPSRVGKRAIAHQFASTILCANPGDGPCGSCSSCKQIEKGNHPDFLELSRDPEKKQIGVDEIREKIIHPLHLSSFLGNAKVAIIDQAHELGIEAANALLKTLEEPPAHSYIILVSDSPELLPDTIRSRCQSCEFTIASQAEIEKFVAALAPNADRTNCQQIASLSRGRPGIAKELVLSPEFLNEQISAQRESVSILLQPIWRRMEYVAHHLGGDSFQQTQSGGQELIERWISSLRDAMCLQQGVKTALVNRFIEEETQRLSEQFTTSQTTRLLRSLIRARSALQQNAQAKLQLENFILEF